VLRLDQSDCHLEMRYQNIFIEVIQSTSRENGTKLKNGTFLGVVTFL